MTKLMQFVRDDSGATAIEYALIAAGISVAIAGIVLSVGAAVVSTFTTVNNVL